MSRNEVLDDSSADSELQAFRADQRANLKWHLKSKGVRSMSTAYNAQQREWRPERGSPRRDKDNNETYEPTQKERREYARTMKTVKAIQGARRRFGDHQTAIDSVPTEARRQQQNVKRWLLELNSVTRDTHLGGTGEKC